MLSRKIKKRPWCKIEDLDFIKNKFNKYIISYIYADGRVLIAAGLFVFHSGLSFKPAETQ